MGDSFETDREAQLRDKAYRIASMAPTEEGYDPERSAKARDLLGRLAKHPVDTQGTEAPQNTRPHVTPDNDVTMQPNPEAKNPFAVPAGMHDFGSPPGDAMQMVKRAGNVAFLGAPNALGDLTGVDSPEARARWDADHGLESDVANAAGGLLPGTALARTVGYVSKGVNAGIGELAAASPRVAAILGLGAKRAGEEGVKAIGRTALRIGGQAATGAGEAAAIGSVSGAMRGVPGGAEGMLHGAEEDAAGSAPYGAGFGILRAAATAGRNKGLQNPDIRFLEERGQPLDNPKASAGTRASAGLDAASEIVPDLAERKVVNQRQLGSLRAGNERSGLAAQPQQLAPAVDIIQAMKARPGTDPATRGRLSTVESELEMAGTQAPKLAPLKAQPSNEDVNALRALREMANNPKGLSAVSRNAIQANIAELEAKLGGTHSEEKTVVEPYTPIQKTADARVAELDSNPPGAKAPGRTIAAGHLQDIAGMSGRLSHPEAGGGPSYPELFALGQKLKQTLPEPMRAQDRAYHGAQTRAEAAQNTLGIEKAPETNLRHQTPYETLERAGGIISDAADSARPGNANARRMADLREMGPPATLRGPPTARWPAIAPNAQWPEGSPGGRPTAGTPDQTDYSALLDLPKIQEAQRNLQFDPRSLLNYHGVVKNTGILLKRGGYPIAKKLAAAPASRPAVVTHDIVSAAKRRKQKSEEE